MYLDYDEIREAELTVIGMAMNDKSVAMDLVSLPNDVFSTDDLIGVKKAIEVLLAKNTTPDLVTLGTECPNDVTSLVEASQLGFMPSNYNHMKSVLLDRMKRRRIYKVCQDTLNSLNDHDFNTESVMANMTKAVENTDSSNPYVRIDEALLNVMNEVQNADKDRCMTGIGGLDDMIGGLKGGKLVYLGARPGIGKSALALFVADHVAHKQGRVLFSSLEMTPEELSTRVLSSFTKNLDVSKIENGHISTEQEWTEFTHGISQASRLNMYITNKAKTPMTLRRIATKLKEEDLGLAMIVVDYVQLMTVDGKSRSRYEDVSNISRELKLLAMDLNIPILVLTQFNRASETNNFGKVVKRRPTMAEAKDSGSIEQDANIFMTLYAPDEPEDRNSYAWQCWNGCKERGHEYQILTIEKNRQGRKGAVNLDFDKPHMIFTTLINDTGKS